MDQVRNAPIIVASCLYNCAPPSDSAAAVVAASRLTVHELRWLTTSVARVRCHR